MLDPSLSPFWNEYCQLVQRLLHPVAASDGVTEIRLVETEERLGLELPRLLREFYLLVGEREDINGVFHRLVSPEELSVEKGVLVFYEENQGVCRWGVDVREAGVEDPAVLREDSTEEPSWQSDFDHLSQFLPAMLLLQAVNGGMRYSGVGSADATRIAAASEWENVAPGGTWTGTVLLREEQALYVLGEGPNPEIFGGAKTKPEFLALGQTFDVVWDYCTLDDTDEPLMVRG